MYGEIAPHLVDKFLGLLEEGKAYELKRFLVNKMKNWYKPVDGEFMIRFGRYTSVRELEGDVMDYPLCTYALTSIDTLPSPSDTPSSFTGHAPYLNELSCFVSCVLLFTMPPCFLTRFGLLFCCL